MKNLFENQYSIWNNGEEMSFSNNIIPSNPNYTGTRRKCNFIAVLAALRHFRFFFGFATKYFSIFIYTLFFYYYYCCSSSSFKKKKIDKNCIIFVCPGFVTRLLWTVLLCVFDVCPLTSIGLWQIWQFFWRGGFYWNWSNQYKIWSNPVAILLVPLPLTRAL